MTTHAYTEVDVFSAVPYRGNPLAVVHDADGLSDADMQRFATWTNLSETTFLLQPTTPDADYRVRIFTATEELPFAGHPTLGTAFAWLQAGGVPRDPAGVVQECGAGPVTVRRGWDEALVRDRLAFAAPPLTRYEAVDDVLVARIAEAMRIPRESILAASWIVNGPEWIGVRLASADEVLALAPDPADLGDLKIGVVGPHSAGSECAFEVRAFLGGDPVWEDPVTGSLNAGLARWLADTGQVEGAYVAAQGTALGREGRVRIDYDGDTIWVGGEVADCVRGEVRF